MNRLLSFLLRPFSPSPKAPLAVSATAPPDVPSKPPTREELGREWDGLLEWLQIEDIPLPEEDAPIGFFLASHHLGADSLPQLQAHEKRLRQELKFHVGNGLCYKMNCLGIVLGLQTLCQAAQQEGGVA